MSSQGPAEKLDFRTHAYSLTDVETGLVKDVNGIPKKTEPGMQENLFRSSVEKVLQDSLKSTSTIVNDRREVSTLAAMP